MPPARILLQWSRGRLLYAVAYEAGGGRPPGLKNSGQTLFSGKAQVAKKL